MELIITLPIDPPTATAQEKKISTRGARPHLYESDGLKDARAKLMAYLAQERPAKPLEGALMLNVGWMFRTTDPAREGTMKTTRPDTENLEKLLKDCMTKLGYWHDDAQVATEIISKRWTMTPGIIIVVSELMPNGCKA